MHPTIEYIPRPKNFDLALLIDVGIRQGVTAIIQPGGSAFCHIRHWNREMQHDRYWKRYLV